MVFAFFPAENFFSPCFCGSSMYSALDLDARGPPQRCGDDRSVAVDVGVFVANVDVCPPLQSNAAFDRIPSLVTLLPPWRMGLWPSLNLSDSNSPHRVVGAPGHH